MPDALITGTASNFGSISGVLAGDAGTVSGTLTGAVTGTLTGSVGVPGPQGPAGGTGPQGPAGPGVPAGGTTGQVLKKISGTDYDTAWQTDLNSGVWGSITGTLTNQLDLVAALALKAPLASPALTGVPTAPTAATLTSTTQIASTAFVQQELAAGTAIAKSLEVYVRNQTGATLTAGTIVYINGATGNRPTVTKAQANNDANSAQTFGFVKTSIANNGFGYVIVRGEVENIDTSALTEGQQLYLSPTTAGTWTTTKPYAPQHLVYVGIVIRSHPNQGVILVAIQNGYELDEIHDVKITTPSNGQVLKYDSAQGLWVNGTDSSGVAWGAITGTLSAQTDLQNALNAKATAADFLSKAGNLSGLASVSTARDNLSLGAANNVIFNSIGRSTGGTGIGDITRSYTVGIDTTYGGNLTFTKYSYTSDGGDPEAPYLSDYKRSDLTAEGLEIKNVTLGTLGAEQSGYRIRIGGVVNDGIYVSRWTAGTPDGYSITPDQLLLNSAGNGVFLIEPQNGITFPDTTVQTTAYPGTSILSGYATESWVTSQGYLTSAPVTSVAGKTGAVTLSNTDISGLGTMATATASDYLAKADNLSGLANTATARTNLGLGTMATETASNYLTTATAASTYQTQAGMSSYLTTASAASTYQTISGMSSYLTTASASSTYAPLASPALTGTPTAPTAAQNTNTTQVATTAYVIGQGNSTAATIAMDGTQAAGTSNLYARADHVHPTDTSRAPLASPTFTGTPAAPTASAGTNTTQIATTAFVQTSNPDASTSTKGHVQLATDAQAQTGSSSTLAIVASSLAYAKYSQSYYRLSGQAWAFTTSGTGSGAALNNGTMRSIPPTTAAGYGICSQALVAHRRISSGGAGHSIPFDWSKRFVAKFRLGPRSLGSDSNTVWRVNFGKTGSTVTGDLAVRGVGIKQAASGAVVLQAHNGTTLSSVTSSNTPTANNWYDYTIVSDGSGNVTLFADDVSVATSSGGPTSGSGTNANFVTIEAENLATITGSGNSLWVSEMSVEFSIA